MTREPRIDAYIAKARPFAQPILEKVRERVHAALPDAEEAIKWSMPAYTSAARSCSSPPRSKPMRRSTSGAGRNRRSSHASVGAMGQFGKLKGDEDLPSDAELDRLLRDAAELAKAAPAPRKTKHEPKPAPELHPEFAAALEEAPKAKAALDGFPPSARRDYFEWIAEAKQDATRRSASSRRSSG